MAYPLEKTNGLIRPPADAAQGRVHHIERRLQHCVNTRAGRECWANCLVERVEVTLVACWVPAHNLVGRCGGPQEPGCGVGFYRGERDGADLAVHGTDKRTIAYDVDPAPWQAQRAYWKAILIPCALNVSIATQILLATTLSVF